MKMVCRNKGLPEMGVHREQKQQKTGGKGSSPQTGQRRPSFCRGSRDILKPPPKKGGGKADVKQSQLPAPLRPSPGIRGLSTTIAISRTHAAVPSGALAHCLGLLNWSSHFSRLLTRDSEWHGQGKFLRLTAENCSPVKTPWAARPSLAPCRTPVAPG